MGFDELIDGTRGFINFSQNLLLNGTPLLLPAERLVIEIVERTDITPELVAACRKLRRLGYTLALDNFLDDEAYRPLAELADIIKVDYHSTPAAVQGLMIKKYRHVTFLAMKVETEQEYNQACALGYSLFQGYFFNKPVMVSSREIGTLGNSMVRIIQKLNQPEPDLVEISAIIENDVELTYKLLRIANSAFYRARLPINSVRHAITQIGLIELRRWAHLLLIKGLSNAENVELIKLSLIRGRMLAMFAEAANQTYDQSEYMITGMFSSIDALLGENMNKVLSRLPLSESVKAALMGESCPLRSALDAVLAFENADWRAADVFLIKSGLPAGSFTSMYLRAVKWQQTLNV